MIKFQYKNLKFEFKYVYEDEEEGLGSSYATFPFQPVLNLIKENSNYPIDLEEYNCREICETFGNYEESFEYFLNNLEKEESFETSDIDLQIILFHHFLDLEEEITIQVFGSNPYWILHDLCHAENDVNYFGIDVNAYIELDRLLEGVELAHKLGLKAHVNVELIQIIAKDFKDRWRVDFNIEKTINLLNK